MAIAWPRSIGLGLNHDNPTKKGLVLWLRRARELGMNREKPRRCRAFEDVSRGVIAARTRCQIPPSRQLTRRSLRSQLRQHPWLSQRQVLRAIRGLHGTLPLRRRELLAERAQLA